MRWTWRVLYLVPWLCAAAPLAALPDGEPGPPGLTGLQRIIDAYPAYLLGIEGDELIWRDGGRTPFNMLGIPARDPAPYANRPQDARLIITETISAVRVEPIYLKIYGDCRQGGVEPRLTGVPWIDGNSVTLTQVNGVAERLKAVAEALAQLPGEMRPYLTPLGGTYACRDILFSARRSMHAFGIAIDINPAHGDYWLWAAKGRDGAPVRRNRIPEDIVAAFEREGFVWGGRWNRFDTFHFEYRPEYLKALGGVWPDRLTRARFSGPSGIAPPGRDSGPCFFRVRQPGPRFGQCLTRGRMVRPMARLNPPAFER